MLRLTTKLINMFCYSITTHFILSNKDYNSYCNPHSMYQMCPKFLKWAVSILLLTLLVVLLTLLTKYWLDIFFNDVIILNKNYKKYFTHQKPINLVPKLNLNPNWFQIKFPFDYSLSMNLWWCTKSLIIQLSEPVISKNLKSEITT